MKVFFYTFQTTFVAFWLFFATTAHAQTMCGFQINESDKLVVEKSLHSRARLSNEYTPLYFPIKVHVVTTTLGIASSTKLNILNGIAGLNKYFQSIHIQFYLCGDFNEITNASLAEFDRTKEEQLAATSQVKGAINMYFVNTIMKNGTMFGGYAYFPNVLSTVTSRVFIANSFLTSNSIIAHEMGHFFGLYHTFENSTNANIAERELVTRGSAANCTTKGDLLCDTPADPYPQGTVLGCVFTATGTFSGIDLNGDMYAPAINNIMSYYSADCSPTQVFTSGQYDRMRSVAETNPDRTNLTCNPALSAIPTNVEASFIGNKVELNWTDNASQELGYFIERSEHPSKDFYSIGAVNENATTYTDSDVEAFKTYYYRIRPANSNLSSANTKIFIPISYCTPTYSNSIVGLNINAVTVSGVTKFENINSGNSALSYGNFAATAATVAAGNTFLLRISLTTASLTYQQYISAWVDWNQDGNFSDSNEKVIFENSTITSKTFTVTVPSGAFNGTTRLRIRSKNVNEGEGVLPCSSYIYGEAEDYSLVIVGGKKQIPLMTSLYLGTNNNYNATTISGSNISLLLPFGTDVTSLLSSFTVSPPIAKIKIGSTELINETTFTNYQNPVVYEVYTGDTSVFYTVNVKVTSAPVVNTVTGVVDELEGNELQLYPNPAEKSVSISSRSPIEMISVYNLSGKLLTEVFADHKFTFDLNLEDLIKGMYMLKTTTNNKIIYKKLIKE